VYVQYVASRPTAETQAREVDNIPDGLAGYTILAAAALILKLVSSTPRTHLSSDST
jgi:hypothetical protein